MTMVCRACSHPDVKKINSLIVNRGSGGNLSEIARRYDLPYNSVWRHSRVCLPGNLSRLGQNSLENHTQSLLNDMGDIMETSKQILQSALDDDHRSLSLKAVKEVRLNIETLAKLFVTMGLAESQDMDKADYEEFMAWKARKESAQDLDLSKLTSLERSALESIARKRLQEQTDLGLYAKDHIVDAEIVEPVPSPPPVKRMRRKPRK